jgi:hypothetical protein
MDKVIDRGDIQHRSEVLNGGKGAQSETEPTLPVENQDTSASSEFTYTDFVRLLFNVRTNENGLKSFQRPSDSSDDSSESDSSMDSVEKRAKEEMDRLEALAASMHERVKGELLEELRELCSCIDSKAEAHSDLEEMMDSLYTAFLANRSQIEVFVLRDMVTMV